MKRNWIVDVIEHVSTQDGGSAQFEVEGALEEAQQEAANAIPMLNRLGGAIVIAAVQHKSGEIPGPNDTDPPAALFSTYKFVFRYHSGMPALPNHQPEAIAADAVD